MPRSIVTGCGSYLPEKVVTNHDLEVRVETNDAWIVERTGIRERHVVGEGEFTSDLAVNAASRALAHAGVARDAVDMVIVATTTPDKLFPSTAAIVQAKLGITRGAAFDIQAVCSGFVYGLSVADNFIKSGQARTVLVIGAEAMSRIVDWDDRGTCILFGDGAGAFVLQSSDLLGRSAENRGILSTHLHTDGKLGDILYTDEGQASGKLGKIRMSGKEVFRHATQKMSDSVEEALEANKLTLDQLDWLVPHQANIRIMQAVGKRLGIEEGKVIVTVGGHANTSAASIPLACDQAVRDGRLKPGNLVVFTALGGGVTWGSAALYW
ncbi:MAG: 3-oxoacyl-ACP synthase [Rickettsiales bacterium]|jgi:3-oxoacyl-[acyl-carrier-protein] synthase-3|nr:3-oxoacyl-ACP synthase [Rickettsiales bacterium]